MTIVERRDAIVTKGMSGINREHLLDQLADLGVVLRTDTRAIRVVDRGVEVVSPDRTV